MCKPATRITKLDNCVSQEFILSESCGDFVPEKATITEAFCTIGLPLCFSLATVT
jgi:hypothetical protein